VKSSGKWGRPPVWRCCWWRPALGPMVFCGRPALGPIFIAAGAPLPPGHRRSRRGRRSHQVWRCCWWEARPRADGCASRCRSIYGRTPVPVTPRTGPCQEGGDRIRVERSETQHCDGRLSGPADCGASALARVYPTFACCSHVLRIGPGRGRPRGPGNCPRAACQPCGPAFGRSVGYDRSALNAEVRLQAE
jgi:hypothetical protein